MSSFGETLKRERELRQITLREIAEATKINLRYLDALERNEFRHLPGGVFNRGFVRAFAQHIGIDPEAMIDSYLEEIRKQEARLQEKDRDRARRAAGEPHRVPIAEPPSRPRLGPWIAGAIVLLAVAIAVGFLVIRPRRTAASHEPPVTSQAAEPGTAAPPPAPADAEGMSVRIVLDRPVRGTIVCDGRLVHLLESLPPGALVDIQCREDLLLDADDAGALRVGVGGAEPAPLGAAGTPLAHHRIAAPPPREGRTTDGAP